MLDLPHGIPSHDTFGRVYARLDAQAFADCFLQWVQDLTQGQVIAHRWPERAPLSRGPWARTGQRGPPHRVNAWATAHRLVRAQQEVDTKFHAITAIPALLQK